MNDSLFLCANFNPSPFELQEQPTLFRIFITTNIKKFLYLENMANDSNTIEIELPATNATRGQVRKYLEKLNVLYLNLHQTTKEQKYYEIAHRLSVFVYFLKMDEYNEVTGKMIMVFLMMLKAKPHELPNEKATP